MPNPGPDSARGDVVQAGDTAGACEAQRDKGKGFAETTDAEGVKDGVSGDEAGKGDGDQVKASPCPAWAQPCPSLAWGSQPCVAPCPSLAGGGHGGGIKWDVSEEPGRNQAESRSRSREQASAGDTWVPRVFISYSRI